MKKTLTALLLLTATVWVEAGEPAQATSIHRYKHSEYAIVQDGMAPDKRFSVASHGGGDEGYDNFHLYLMREPAHKKLAIFDSITGDAVLDTGPDGYRAVWSPDSRYVAVYYRLSHQVLTMLLYEMSARRPIELSAPSLFSIVAKPLTEASNGLDLKSGSGELKWLDATTFVMKEHQLFTVSTHDLARKLGTYGRETVNTQLTSHDDKGNPVTWYFVDFSAEAVCKVVPGRGYRIVSMKPGEFEQLD